MLAMGEEVAVSRESAVMSILIVDDEPSIREMCLTVAQQTGMKAIAVATPDEALEVLEHAAVDIVLTDLMLQHSSGLDLMKRVRDTQLAPSGALRHAAPKGRVLVVEDEPTVARLIGDVLEDDGFRVDLLFDGREALKRAAEETYDLVICDMKMPRLDGERFYKTLARTGNPLREKFLFVTGDVIAAQTHEFLERNHLPCLTKPFRIEELTEKVNFILGAGQQPVSSEVARSGAARK